MFTYLDNIRLKFLYTCSPRQLLQYLIINPRNVRVKVIEGFNLKYHADLGFFKNVGSAN